MKKQQEKITYMSGLKRIIEMNVAGGPGGMFSYGGGGGDIGTHGGAVGNSDFYAQGDARIPKSIYGGQVLTRAGATGAKKKKKKKKKKSTYKEAFSNTTQNESVENQLPLACMLYTENIQYLEIISDLLEKQEVYYNRDGDAIIVEGTDEQLNGVLCLVEGLLTSEPFENGELVSFIGEMSVNLEKPNKSVEDYDSDELAQGTETELEHVNVDALGLDEARKAAAIIAMHHLDEDPRYYSKLEKVHDDH